MLKPSNGSYFGRYEIAVEKEIKTIGKLLEKIEFLQIMHFQPLVLEELQTTRALLVKAVRENDIIVKSKDQVQEESVGKNATKKDFYG